MRQAFRFGSCQDIRLTEKVQINVKKDLDVKEIAGMCFSAMVNESGFPLNASSLVGVAYDETKDVCAAWSLRRLIWAKGFPTERFLEELSSEDSPNVAHVDFQQKLKELVSLRDREKHYLVLQKNGELHFDGDHPSVLLSGSFNPLHEGHEGLLKVAALERCLDGGFELAIRNADKGEMDIEDVLVRMSQFAGKYALVITCVPTFLEKAEILKENTAFAVGIDTAQRMPNPRYYGGEEGAEKAREALEKKKSTFLVAGRAVDGEFCNQIDRIEGKWKDLFHLISFRKDISSTEIRRKASEKKK